MTVINRQSAFIYGATESIAEMALPVILSTARYTVLAYDIVTSPEARQTYQWVKEMTIALGQLAFWSVVWAYAKTTEWAESEVAACLPTDDHTPDAGEMVGADPFAPEANPHHAAVPAAIAAPVVTLVVPTTTAYQAMTTTELRKVCQKATVKWRNAHGKGKHLSKPEMIAALTA